jgi:hypothetical protein
MCRLSRNSESLNLLELCGAYLGLYRESFTFTLLLFHLLVFIPPVLDINSFAIDAV